MAETDRLKDLLRPLGIYELGSGFGAAELAAVGSELDAAMECVTELEREFLLGTAQSYGLESREALLPYRPASVSVEGRRAAITALLRIGGDSFTLSKLNATLAGCGIAAEVAETATRGEVSVSFPGTRGVPERIDALKERIEAILPAHVSVSYAYLYTTWAELESWIADWAELASAVSTWADAERYTE